MLAFKACRAKLIQGKDTLQTQAIWKGRRTGDANKDREQLHHIESLCQQQAGQHVSEEA